MRKLQKLYRWYVLSMLIMLPTTLLTLWNDKGIMAIPNIIAKFALSLTLLQTIPSMSNFSYILNGVGWFLSALLVLYAVYPVLERLQSPTWIDPKTRTKLPLWGLFTSLFVPAFLQFYCFQHTFQRLKLCFTAAAYLRFHNRNITLRLVFSQD